MGRIFNALIPYWRLRWNFDIKSSRSIFNKMKNSQGQSVDVRKSTAQALDCLKPEWTYRSGKNPSLTARAQKVWRKVHYGQFHLATKGYMQHDSATIDTDCLTQKSSVHLGFTHKLYKWKVCKEDKIVKTGKKTQLKLIGRQEERTQRKK